MAEKQMWCRSGACELCGENRLSCGCDCHKPDTSSPPEKVAAESECHEPVITHEQPDMFEERPKVDIDKIMEVARERTADGQPTSIKAESLRALCDEIDNLRDTIEQLMPNENSLGKFHRKAPSTEKKAAYEVQPRSGTQRMAVLICIASSETGMTDPEVSEATGIYLYSAAPRRNELLMGGWVKDSGRRRATENGGEAIVWEATDKTQALVASGATVKV